MNDFLQCSKETISKKMQIDLPVRKDGDNLVISSYSSGRQGWKWELFVQYFCADV